MEVTAAALPGEICGEADAGVEDAPAEDHGVVDVAQEAREEHPVAQTLESRHHAPVQLDQIESLHCGLWLMYQCSCF